MGMTPEREEGCALDLIIADDPAWCPEVFAILTDPKRCWEHSTQERAARYLGRHGYRLGAVIDHFWKRKKRPWGLLIELALGGNQDRLGTFLRGGLRSDWPDDRLMAAAALAVINQDWSRRELFSALNESENPETTLEIREALRLRCGPEAARAVECWEAAHPEREPQSPVDSTRMYYEVTYGGITERMLTVMEGLSGRVPRAANA